MGNFDGSAGSVATTLTEVGGAGVDLVTYAAAAAGVTANLTAGTATGDGSDTLTNIENLIGSAFNDVLSGATGANLFTGGDGNDSLSGGDSNDTLAGGIGNDTLAGGNGDDLASNADASAAVTVRLALTTAQNTGGSGIDTLTSIEHVTGSAFNDSLQGNNSNNNLTGGDGDDNLLGGAGSDTASYITATAGVTIDLGITVAQNTGSAGMDRLVQVENVRGSAYADMLSGNAAVNSINAAEGNDVVYGLGGNDTLTGGTGADDLHGGDSQDTISGGDDNDIVVGDVGLDNLKGDAGNDTIHGGTENDTINGGTDDDILYGDAGRDVLTGDLGADTFVFAAVTDSGATAALRDQIRDFSAAQGDKIDLGAIDAVTGGSDDAFTFIGAGAFTGVAGQVHAVVSGTNWVVEGDVNGDKVADFAIQVTSSAVLAATDFVL